MVNLPDTGLQNAAGSFSFMKAEAKLERIGPDYAQNLVRDFLSSLLSDSERIIVYLVVYFRTVVNAVPQL